MGVISEDAEQGEAREECAGELADDVWGKERWAQAAGEDESEGDGV